MTAKALDVRAFVVGRHPVGDQSPALRRFQVEQSRARFGSSGGLGRAQIRVFFRRNCIDPEARSPKSLFCRFEVPFCHRFNKSKPHRIVLKEVLIFRDEQLFGNACGIRRRDLDTQKCHRPSKQQRHHSREELRSRVRIIHVGELRPANPGPHRKWRPIVRITNAQRTNQQSLTPSVASTL